MGCVTSCNPSSPPDSPFRTYVAPMLVTQLVDLASHVEDLQPSAADEAEDEEADRGVPDGRDGNTSACSVRTLQSLLERGQHGGSGASCTLHVPHQTSIDSEVTVYSEWSECTVAGNDRNTEDCDTRTKTENSDDDLRASSLTRQEMGGKVLLY
ncbi:Hypp7299 [Branchiostoma lanceolatum]|uniref:Hypp7299 protein n=1 Tax=Branchiostoma lanceolatum TaxID=7740 RepID=A0A8J9YZI0_BRALA|nr:Hypp7299 [Branchiostoma lanceolatum]